LHGTTPREPWYYDDETLQIARYYFDLRGTLKPYLLKLAAEAVEDGAPMWRPLIWEFPEAKDIDDEFLLGHDFLVAPILSESDERLVYLPAGEWQDAWTHRRLTGPTNLLYQAALSVIPVFTRNGWTLPAPVTTPAIELAGQTNTRGIVPTQRIWRGQKYEKIFLSQRDGGDVTLDAPPGFEVLPGQTQRGERVAFYVMWPADLTVGSYPVKVGSIEMVLVKPPPWPTVVRDDGYVDLGKVSETEATFTAHAGNASLLLGSGDGITVWLNDRQVFDKQVHRSPERDEDVTHVQLCEGVNRLRVKLTRPPGAIGPNGFYLRVAL
jgi:hypothetical protein